MLLISIFGCDLGDSDDSDINQDEEEEDEEEDDLIPHVTKSTLDKIARVSHPEKTGF